MIISLEIPKEFEEHFNMDRFEDSLERIYGELESDEGHYILAGKYELELIKMLRDAMAKAEVIKE